MSPFSLAVGFLPVVLFLFALLALDSYKLVTRRQVLGSILWGGIAAGLSFLANRTLLHEAGFHPVMLQRYAAPFVEEVLKAAWVLVLLRRARVGFLVDAAVHGFAAGTGFALVENVWYAHALGDSNPWLWVLRGLGTAVMHGSTTAVVAIATKAIADRHPSLAARALPLAALPGLAVAFAAHSAYNHLVLNPLVTTAIVLVVSPAVLFAAFEVSERATREWLGHGLDRDAELLELIHSGAIVGSPAGQYLTTLRTRFPGPVVADMLCLLEVRLELGMRAKGLMLAQAAGVDVPVGPEVLAHLDELTFLERAIGPTGRLAMQPLLPEGRDRWQITLLEKRRAPAARG